MRKIKRLEREIIILRKHIGDIIEKIDKLCTHDYKFVKDENFLKHEYGKLCKICGDYKPSLNKEEWLLEQLKKIEEEKKLFRKEENESLIN